MSKLLEAGDVVISTPGTVDAIDQKLTELFDRQAPRGHLGMSGIGNPDQRTQWLKFRWSLPDNPAPRTLRIFELGNILEDEVVRLLKVGGIDVWEVDPDTGHQFNFKHLGGHFAGSADGVVRGIPESKKAHVLEVKSAKSSKFNELEKLKSESLDHNTALKKWNQDYFGQTQCYMQNLGLDRTLFLVYNKDTSSLLTLRIKPEKFYWDGALATAFRIIDSDEIPESSFPNRNWYEIKKYKSEEYQAVYWGDQLPSPNCRNCRSCKADLNPERIDAAWHCSLKDIERSIEEQVTGCSSHNFMPALVPAKFIQVHEEDNAVEYETSDGARFFNAGLSEHASCVFSSGELAAVSKAGLTKDTLFDPVSNELRAEFEGRIIDVHEV